MAESPDLELWRTVLLAGLTDAARGVDDDWIGSRDFRHVCWLADLDPDAVMNAYKPERYQMRRNAARLMSARIGPIRPLLWPAMPSKPMTMS